MRTRAVIGILGALLLGTRASAQQQDALGDVVVSGYSVSANPMYLDARMVVYGSNGAFKRELLPRTPLYIGEPQFDANARLFVPISGRLAIVAPDGSSQREVYGSPCCFEFFALNKTGTAFGLFGGADGVLELRPDGGLRSDAVPDMHLQGVDLDADQCTLFVTGYTDVNHHSVGQVAEVNVCDPARPVRSLFSLPIPYPGPVRILPDGDLLIGSMFALGSAGDPLLKVGRDGTVHRSYPIRTWAMAVDDGGRSAWIVTPAGISKLDLASGNTLIGPIASPFDYSTEGIAVRGAGRAAIPPVAVPALGLGGLVALAAMLIAVALLVHRHA